VPAYPPRPALVPPIYSHPLEGIHIVRTSHGRAACHIVSSNVETNVSSVIFRPWASVSIARVRVLPAVQFPTLFLLRSPSIASPQVSGRSINPGTHKHTHKHTHTPCTRNRSRSRRGGGRSIALKQTSSSGCGVRARRAKLHS
jgi:hypothetical protein